MPPPDVKPPPGGGAPPPGLRRGFTENDLYTAWRGLYAAARGRAASTAENEAVVTPAMDILLAALNEVGFAIIDGKLVELPELPVHIEPVTALFRRSK